MLNNFYIYTSLVLLVNSLFIYNNSNFTMYSIVNTTYMLIVNILLLVSSNGYSNLTWVFFILLFMGSVEAFIFTLSV